LRVHQLLPVFRPHDAMSQAAVGFQWLLRRLGHLGAVYASEVQPGYGALVQPASQLRVTGGDLVLYHHGIASELASALLHLPCRRGVIFHNITPARFYRGTALAEALTAGRAQLSAMAPAVHLSLGVSHFNASELRIAGHTNVHTVPLFIEPARFDADAADEVFTRSLAGHAPLVVCAGRVVPHKRIEDVLALHAELRRLAPDARTLVVGAAAKGDRYFRALPKHDGVTFTGPLTHAELVSAYRAADVFVSMSEHEGFGVPLLEAMASDVPVLAFAAAAVPETLDGRGIAFDEKRFAALAELVMQLRLDDKLRTRVVDGQRERVEAQGPHASQAALAGALATLELEHKAPVRRHHRAGRPRVAVVVQRYAERISGGAEAHARMIALHLSAHADVTVLTTTASDHLTWQDVLTEGEAKDGAVRVLRFRCGGTRQMRAFNRLSAELLGEGQSRVEEERWLLEQGPRAPGLLEHLRDQGSTYDAVIFFTYLYAPTAHGLPLVADRALLVPTAHDEPPLAFDLYADVFELPQATLCNTPEEARLITQRFPAAVRPQVVGVGVDVPQTDAERFRARFAVTRPYLLYVGRLEAGKGLKELLKHHRDLSRSFPDAPELLIAGTGDLHIRGGPNVRALGRISDQEKYDGLAGAVAAVVPSRLESLSLLTLEAFACRTPVVGNAESEVVAGHLTRSGAGFAFSSTEEYVDAVKRAAAERDALSAKAAAYARRFRWPKVVEAYLVEIERIRKARR
jgi:glycosyltransferase involved in cell wall biosynthesis